MMDEHSEPTEPLPPLPASAFADEATTPHEPTLPLPPPPLVLPKPPLSYPTLPPAPAQADGLPSVYPYLPERPGQRPATPSSASKGQKRSVIPHLVGLCFVAVQLLLLVRFVLKIIALSADTTWVGLIYLISNLFIWPFTWLFQSIQLPITINIEFYTLLAILVYGLISRLLVKLLKAWL